MKNLLALSLRYLKTQKRRTAATALGIIMSVMLVTCTAVYFDSGRDMQLRRGIDENGTWHYSFYYGNTDKIKKLNDNYLIEAAGVSASDVVLNIGKSNAGVIDRSNRIRLNEQSVECMKMMPYEIVDGRLPQNAGEIALDKSAAALCGNAAVGDTITYRQSRIVYKFVQMSEKLRYAEEDPKDMGIKSYKVVGIYEKELPSAEAEAVTADPVGMHDYKAYVKVKPCDDYMKSLKAALADCEILQDNFTENDILNYIGQSKDEDSAMRIISLAVFFLFIFAVTVIAISNTFSMSMTEKISQVGILRCLGASPAQIRSIIFGEAFIIWTVALPTGVLASVATAAAAFKMIFTADDRWQMRVILSPSAVLFAAVFSFLAVFFSAYLPAHRSGRISIIEAVNGSDGSRGKIKKNRKGKWYSRMFGFSGFLAAKSARRNPRRFCSTVRAVAVSVASFMVIGGFSISFLYTYFAEDAMRENYFDYSCYVGGEKDPAEAAKISKKFYEDLSAIKAHADELDGVTDSQIFEEEHVRLKVPEDKKNIEFIKEGYETVINVYGEAYWDGLWETSVYSISRENYAKLNFASKAPSYDELVSSGDAVMMSRVYKIGAGKSVPAVDFADYKVGDKVDFIIPNYAIGAKDKSGSLRIAALLNEYPWYVEKNNGCIVMPEENYRSFFEKIHGQARVLNTTLRLRVEDDYKKIEDALNELAANYPSVTTFTWWTVQDESMELFKRLCACVFSFLAMIIFICCTSVFNTVHSSFLMRKKELAVLRAVGMSRGQLIKTLLLECSLYGVIGTFWGSLIGVPLLLLLSAAFENVITASLLSPLKYVAAALIASVLISIIAGAEPIRKIIKTPVIDQLRSQD